jgi:small subunit ribosomal protein S1
VEIPEQVVQVGDDILVKVIDIDLDRRRISLSLKQANEGAFGEDETFDPAAYGMAAAYDDQGNYIYPEGFDSETGEWREGFESQREEWERQYAEAQNRYEAHRKQIADARAADAEAAAGGNYTSGEPASTGDTASTGGTLASDEALAALRAKLAGGE